MSKPRIRFQVVTAGRPGKRYYFARVVRVKKVWQTETYTRKEYAENAVELVNPLGEPVEYVTEDES